ncbi:hypothetical protein Tco_0108814 [Tanacetum coccineum]
MSCTAMKLLIFAQLATNGPTWGTSMVQTLTAKKTIFKNSGSSGPHHKDAHDLSRTVTRANSRKNFTTDEMSLKNSIPSLESLTCGASTYGPFPSSRGKPIIKYILVASSICQNWLKQKRSPTNEASSYANFLKFPIANFGAPDCPDCKTPQFCCHSSRVFTSSAFIWESDIPNLMTRRSGYQQKDRKPSQNDKTEHGMEKTVQNQGQSPKMLKSESILKNQQSKRSRN